jgi:hypothetical protein
MLEFSNVRTLEFVVDFILPPRLFLVELHRARRAVARVVSSRLVSSRLVSEDPNRRE